MLEYYTLIAVMFIYLYYFFWISNLEKKAQCKCSQDYRRTFIKYGAIVLLSVNVVACLFMNQFDAFITGSRFLNKAVSNGLLLFLICYIYFMYTYANDFLNKENCKCLGKVELLFIRFHALFIGLLMSFRVVRALCL